MSSVKCKLWLNISQIIFRAVESNYIQNDRAGHSFLGKRIFSWAINKMEELLWNVLNFLCCAFIGTPCKWFVMRARTMRLRRQWENRKGEEGDNVTHLRWSNRKILLDMRQIKVNSRRTAWRTEVWGERETDPNISEDTRLIDESLKWIQ